MFERNYVIGRPYSSETTGMQGVSQTETWFDQDGHITGGVTNGSGVPDLWSGKTHGEYMAAVYPESAEGG